MQRVFFSSLLHAYVVHCTTQFVPAPFVKHKIYYSMHIAYDVGLFDMRNKKRKNITKMMILLKMIVVFS